MVRLLHFGSAQKHLIPDKVCSGCLPTISVKALAPGITGGTFLKDSPQQFVCLFMPAARQGPPFHEGGI